MSRIEGQNSNYMMIVMDIHQMAEDVSKDHLALTSSQIRSDLSELEDLSQKKSEAIQKYTKGIESQKAWNTMIAIAQYATSILTIGIGMSKGPLTATGFFMVASGGISLLHRLGQDTGAFQAIATYLNTSQHLQEKMKNRVDSALFIMNVGMILSSALLLSQGNIGALNQMDKVAIVSMATLNNSLRFGKTTVDRNVAYITAHLRDIEAKNFHLRKNVEELSTQSKNTIEMMDAISANTRKMIASIEV